MIAEFFENREIFITGGSGVVGKALLDKLLRSCNVRKIYVLLRPKKNQSLEQRLEKIKKSMIFRRLHKEKPTEFDDKIVPVPGDAEQYLLGITPEFIKLMENVSIVYHGAATVRFDEPLKDAIRLNVGGTHEALKVAETLKNLVLFMHISTFYSNPYLKFVEPKLYASPMDWKFCLDLSRREDLSEEMLDALTKKLVVGFPNTYCFTKNLAETLVNEHRDKFPVGIYRPAIVVFAIDEPEPGYPPSLMGAMGLFAVASAGILKTLYMAKDQRLDLSPQDVAIKSILYYTLKATDIYSKSRPIEAPIYHTSLYTHNYIKFAEYCRMLEDNGLYNEAPLEKSLWLPSVYCTDNRLIYILVVIFMQLLPCMLVDLILMMCGRKPALMQAQRKIWITLKSMQPFLFNNYESTGCSYAKEMQKVLDGTEFHMSPLRYANDYYGNLGIVHNMIFGVREFLFKEDPATLPRARIIHKIKIYFCKILQVFLAYKAYQKIVEMIPYWQLKTNDFNSTMFENAS